MTATLDKLDPLRAVRPGLLISHCPFRAYLVWPRFSRTARSPPQRVSHSLPTGPAAKGGAKAWRQPGRPGASGVPVRPVAAVAALAPLARVCLL